MRWAFIPTFARMNDRRFLLVGIPVLAALELVPRGGHGGPLGWHWLGDYDVRYRPKSYWQAGTDVSVDLDLNSIPAGNGIYGQESRTVDFSVGDAHVYKVDMDSYQMRVFSNGTLLRSIPITTGEEPAFTTRSGTKVIMEKGRSICMRGPGYYECGVKFTQRLTYGGEYLHAAPWNVSHINSGVDSSNGCTNLLTKDAEQLYGFLGVGDVVNYPNANGPAMTLGAGYGDWNVQWASWLTGGLVSTT